MLRLLTFTSLYPSDANPQNGIFIENRTNHLNGSGQVNLKVVAPVPWFPFRRAAFGRYANFAGSPRRAVRNGIDVFYPRFPAIPAIGMSLAPILMAQAVYPRVRRIVDESGELDAIDSYYLYPDGVAAAIIAKKLDKPLIMTALGTDVNVLPGYLFPRKWILWAAERAAAISTVSAALKVQLSDLGVENEKIHLILHGVDHGLFRASADKSTIRRKLGIQGRTLLCVGNLVESKGQHLVIEALSALTDVSLVIVGKGKRETALRRQARELGLADRVKLLGHVHQRDLPGYYAAADALVLPSSREGIPNVVLEAMSCGTPVIATKVGGIPEVVTTRAAGVLLEERSAESIVHAVGELFVDYPARSDTVAAAKSFSWDTTTAMHLTMIRDALSMSRQSRRG